MTTSTEVELNQVLDYISSAERAHLDVLIEAINDRRKSLSANAARLNLATLAPGTKVQLSGLSPKYLNGTTGVVVGPARAGKNAIEVRWDDESVQTIQWSSRGRRQFGATVCVPAQCLTAVGDA